MSNAEAEPDETKILLHSRAELRDDARTKTERARAARRVEAEAAAARLIACAGSGGPHPDSDAFCAAVAMELVYEFSVADVSIALAATTALGGLYTTGHPCEQNGSDLAECPRQVVESTDHAIQVWRTGLSRDISRDLTTLPNRSGAASSLRAFGYGATSQQPAVSITLHCRDRRSFDPMDIAVLDAVANAVLEALCASPPGGAAQRATRP